MNNTANKAKYESFKGEYLGNKWMIEQNKRTGSYYAQIVHPDGEVSAITCERPSEYMKFFDDYCVNIYA